MERLWSYLRRFGRMTKEMRPALRIDILSHALAYYGMQTKEKLGLTYTVIKTIRVYEHFLSSSTCNKMGKSPADSISSQGDIS